KIELDVVLVQHQPGKRVARRSLAEMVLGQEDTRRDSDDVVGFLRQQFVERALKRRQGVKAVFEAVSGEERSRLEQPFASSLPSAGRYQHDFPTVLEHGPLGSGGIEVRAHQRRSPDLVALRERFHQALEAPLPSVILGASRLTW